MMPTGFFYASQMINDQQTDKQANVFDGSTSNGKQFAIGFLSVFVEFGVAVITFIIDGAAVLALAFYDTLKKGGKTIVPVSIVCRMSLLVVLAANVTVLVYLVSKRKAVIGFVLGAVLPIFILVLVLLMG